MSNLASQIIYETRLVAFIDVMGFKEILDKPLDLQRYFDCIFRHLNDKKEAFASHNPKDGFESFAVSDSIILSVALDNTDDLKKTANFINTVGWLQYYLAVNAQIWTRGAISVGNLYHKEQVIVGQAFVNAYNLEKVANYSRVIIDPLVCKHLQLLPNDFITRINSQNFEVKLLQDDANLNVGQPMFIVDSLQIDWFSLAIKYPQDIKPFLEDIGQRMVLSQDLFEKSRLLLRYIRKSFDDNWGEEDGSNPNNNARKKMINSLIEKMGF